MVKEKQDKQLANRVVLNAATGVQIRIAQSGSETAGRLLELEATYPPHSAEPPRHFHPRQDEEFVIVSGSMMANIAGGRLTVASWRRPRDSGRDAALDVEPRR